MEEEKSPKLWLEDQLRRTLNGLYDPGILLNNPLNQVFNMTKSCNPASALRRLLTDAIESLRPTPSTPMDTQTWRVYQILRRRYIEQLTQQQVSTNLGLSVRQLQRNEKLARQVLVEYLWSNFNLDEVMPNIAYDQNSAGVDMETPPSLSDELDWLEETVPAQTIRLGDILNEVISMLEPMIESRNISAVVFIPDGLSKVYVKAPLLRQALLNILNTAMLCSRPDKTIQVTLTQEEQQIELHLEVPEPYITDTLLTDLEESFQMAQQLIDLCQGQLCIENLTVSNTNMPQTLQVIITLPAVKLIDILVIDDNADVLQLYQRYLEGSPYRFKGSRDPQQGLHMAQDIHPEVIILDVMMPGQDGWTLLGQLREHPKTQDIPIIVCSILPQEEFAQALGAADFIRKPVTRQSFLEVLDRQLAQLQRECD
ncbi:MAG: response regulator [Anaerolineae bacterium]|nr:response regulator [Anaerolineae bacterium]